MKLHIIEDNLKIRAHLETFLGHQEDIACVQSHTSVEFFLSAVDSGQAKPDVILLDIGLPGMSGVEGIPEITQRLPETDIIMLTTYEEEEVILNALCAGAHAYLSKKSSLQEIHTAIKVVRAGGSYMSPNIARQIVRHFGGSRTPKKAEILTERQLKVLKLLVDGLTYGAIAKELFISAETVKTHVKNIYKSLHVSNKAEAIQKYMRGEI